MIFSLVAWSQPATYITISGTVYDKSARNPVERVSVHSSSGRGTITDSLGRYSLTILKKDSIWFSFLNKQTIKYSTDTIKDVDQFNIMLFVQATEELPEVKLKTKNYRLDSLENRREYAKYFNFKKPSLSTITSPSAGSGGLTVAFDLDEIINMFRFKRNRQLQALQDRLIRQEQDRYVEHRFSKRFITQLTGLKNEELDDFMLKFKPQYELVCLLNDIELGYYIQRSYEQYKKLKK